LRLHDPPLFQKLKLPICKEKHQELNISKLHVGNYIMYIQGLNAVEVNKIQKI